MKHLPRAVHSADLHIGPLTLRCHVLDDGRRIIEAESMAAFMQWLESPEATVDQVARFTEQFSAWMQKK